MAVTYQTPVTNQGFSTSATSRTISVTVNAGSNFLLVAFCGEAKTDVVTSATYNGVSLTQVPSGSQVGASFGNAELWGLANPTVGTANLVVNHSSSFHVVIGALVAAGVDTANPYRTVAKTAVSSTSASVNVSTAATGDLVVGVLQIDGTGHAAAPGTNETEEYETVSAAGANQGSLYTQAGVNGGVINPSWTTSADACLVATALVAAAAASGTPMPFAPWLPKLQRRPGWPFAFPIPPLPLPSGVTYNTTGSVTAGVTASGADVYEAAETGSVTTRALSSGADVFEASETGSLTPDTLVSGPDSFQPTESGSLTAGTLPSGADVYTAAETGTVPVGTLLSGTSTYIPAGPATYNKTGSVTAGTLLSGTDSFQPAETGSLTTRALSSGADVFTAAETGTAPVGTVLSGTSQFVSGAGTTYTKTGSLTAGTQPRGADSYTAVEAGSLTVGALVSGSDAYTAAETGALLVDTLLAGVKLIGGPTTPAAVSVTDSGLVAVAVQDAPGRAVTVADAPGAQVTATDTPAATVTARDLSGPDVTITDRSP